MLLLLGWGGRLSVGLRSLLGWCLKWGGIGGVKNDVAPRPRFAPLHLRLSKVGWCLGGWWLELNFVLRPNQAPITFAPFSYYFSCAFGYFLCLDAVPRSTGWKLDCWRKAHVLCTMGQLHVDCCMCCKVCESRLTPWLQSHFVLQLLKYSVCGIHRCPAQCWSKIPLWWGWGGFGHSVSEDTSFSEAVIQLSWGDDIILETGFVWRRRRSNLKHESVEEILDELC